MFADPPASLTPILIAAGASFSAAIVAAVAAIWGNLRAGSNARDLEEYKRATNSDLARLNIRLAHGQLVSSTQWSAEFSAYQAIWQALVKVRDDALQIAAYEAYLDTLGLADVVPKTAQLKSLHDGTKALDASLTQLAKSVLNNAPFYSADVRKLAMEVNNTLRLLVTGLLAFVVAEAKRESWTEDQMIPWRAARNAELRSAFEAIEHVETAIRNQLDKVSVVD